MFRLAVILVSIAVIVLAILAVFASKEVQFSFIVAYVSSLMVVMASFNTYKKMVEKGLQEYADSNSYDDRDYIDKLDDPYNLFNEEEIIEDSNKSFKEIIKEEKKILKQNRRPIKNIIIDSIKSFSITRMGAYLAVVLGFLFLVKTNNFSILTYMITLMIPNILVVAYLLNFKSE